MWFVFDFLVIKGSLAGRGGGGEWVRLRGVLDFHNS